MTTRDEFKAEQDPSAEQEATDKYIKKIEAENRRLKAAQGTDEKLYDAIKDAIEAFPPPKTVNYPQPKLAHDDLEACLWVTDPHSEESVRLEEMEGLVSYDFETFERRMDLMCQKTLELVNIMRQSSNIRKLTISLLGDMFVGKILPQEEAYGTTMPFPVALPKTSWVLGKAITSLSGHFDEVRVVGICGNHGRDTMKPVTKMTADRNWDMGAYLIAKDHTRDCPNVEWILPKSIFKKIDIAGHGCLLSHSAEAKMHHRIPYYGIETAIDLEKKLRRGTPEDFTYSFMGHFHHFAVLDNDITICPSMIGPNQYSRFKLHRAAPAEQLLSFFTQKHGYVAPWRIRL